MPNNFVIDKLSLVLESIKMIENYFQEVSSAKHFETAEGVMVYDAVLMRLQVIGENIKKLQKHNSHLFAADNYEVTSIIRFREIISHHYEKLDTEVIFEICTRYLPSFKKRVEELLNSSL